MMRFTPWYDAEEIEARAPAAGGVFQVRGPGLLDYPTGRSAMLHYGHADELRGAMGAWAAQHGQPGWRYRHAHELGAKSPEQAHALLEARFSGRFGVAPSPTPAAPSPPED